MMHGQQNITK